MRHAFRYIIIFACVVFFARANASQGLRVVSSSSSSLVVEFEPENWDTRTITSAIGKFHEISFSGADMKADLGSPQMPVKSFTIGVPESGPVSVQIVTSDFETVRDIRLAPLPRIIRKEIGYDYDYEVNEAAYRNNQFAPESIVYIEEPHYFRSQRVVRVVFQPLQYNPVQSTARRYTKIVVQINFSGGSQRTPSVSRIAKDEAFYKNLLNYKQAKSWRRAQQPALRKVQTTQFKGDNWFKIKITGTGNGGKEGMYKISGATLNQALSKQNISLSSIDPSTIQLFNNGGRELVKNVAIAKNDTLMENPILVVGGNDGKFGESDYILFYGRSLEGVDFDAARNKLDHYINPYGYDNIYWLTFNRAKGKRITAVPSEPTSGLAETPWFKDMAWIEEEKHNIFKSGTIWLGQEMTRSNNAYSINFDVPGAVPQERIVLRTSIASLSSNERNYFTLYVNGNTVGQFDQYGGSTGFSIMEKEFIADGVLVDGSNTLTINYNVGSDLAFSYVNYVELEFFRKFVAVNDQLLFHAPLSADGTSRFKITGFSRNDVRVFDVTDISDIREITDFTTSSGAVDFADRAAVLDAKKYVAVSSAAYKSIDAAAISAEKIAGLRKQMDVDYIIITYDDFRQQAEQLESLRENWSPKEKLNTEVVNISDVIKEFGWGLSDPAAIRNFLAYAYDNWGAPTYVLLFGDGHFDYKNILKNNAPNLIVPYEIGGNYETSTRVTDDWFTYIKGNSNEMQMAIGRLVVQTVDEAQNVVDKIVQYETNPEYGEWLKTITIVADDEYTNDTNWEFIHTKDAEILAESHVPKLLDVNKIFLINYPAVKTASITGIEKPAATLDLLEQINKGALMINYIGHGNPDLWAHERVLLNTRDLDKIQNGRRLAMWVAATCEFAHWDQPTSQSFAEDILNAPGRGAVAMVSSARLAYANANAEFNKDLYDNLFADYDGDGNVTTYAQTGLTTPIGLAMMRAKNSNSNRENAEKYNLFGDPAMRLCAPRYRAVIDDITPDSIQALSKMTIKGHIEDQGQPLSAYEGKILVRALDTQKMYTYTNPEGRSLGGLYANGNTIFRGTASVKDGQFDVRFIVPKDISYGGRNGRVSLYFWNDNSSGTGDERGLAVGGTAVDLVDKSGPSMNMYFGESDFVPGDYVSTRPTLHLAISDSVSGVNTAGDIGHQILLTIDEDYNNSIDITEYFTYDEASYTDGVLNYTILDLPIGEHTVNVKAWDNSNNSSIIETHFVVIDDSELEIRKPLTYPNPMTDECSFRYELSQDAQVTIKIFTVAGRLIKKFEPMQSHVGYNIFPDYWYGRDDVGDAVANGVYLYKITAHSNRGDESLTAEIIGKLIVAR